MAKVKPNYDSVKHSGVAAGDDITPAKLNSYDQVKYSGVSTSSQPDVAGQVDQSVYGDGEGAHTGTYQSMQNAGGDTTLHGNG
jgi:hypothetical protein